MVRCQIIANCKTFIIMHEPAEFPNLIAIYQVVSLLRVSSELQNIEKTVTVEEQ